MTAPRPASRGSVLAAPTQLRFITPIAFALALAVIIARLITPDALRDPWEVLPGSQAAHAGPGPATGLVLDLLASLPALLVLLRRAVDSNFRLSLRWSHAPLFALALLAMCSTAWSSDRFAAAVTAAHFFAATSLLWAMSQLVRSGPYFRLFAGICLALLLTLLVQTLMFRFVDTPQNINYWKENKDAVLMAQNLTPGSFAAKQFERKVLSGELLVFLKSANSVAAVALLLFAAGVGIGIQKLVDGESLAWVALPVIAAGSLTIVLIYARSKTSFATPFIGIAVLCAFAQFKQRLAAQHRQAYAIGVGVVALATLAVMAHGLYHHGLFPGHLSNSLDFRWKYWIASAGIFAEHPWIGTGWENFNLYYLAHRVPDAAEAIRDPHNFLIHFFVELGIVGGLLSIVWLLRLALELTRPVSPVNSTDPPLTARFAVAIVVAGSILSILCTEDFSVGFLDLIALMLKPLLLMLVLLFGTIGATMQSTRNWLLDARPAPWIYYCTVTGLGLFLMHNLIDFALFEPGAMFIFMAATGAVQGMGEAKEHRPLSRPLIITTAAIYAIGWLTTAAVFVVPVIAAEQLADDANEAIRTAPPDKFDERLSHYQQAADVLQTACRWVPYNSDYIYRQANALMNIGQLKPAELLLMHARQINPLEPDAYLLDAHLKLLLPNPDKASVQADYETVLRLNPNDVTLHMQYAEALDQFAMHAEAKRQYQLALAANDALPAGEPTRLSLNQIEQLQTAIAKDH